MKYWLIIGLFSTVIILAGCSQTATDSNTQLANPASVFCEEHGGTIEIVDEELGQMAICTLNDNVTKCEEWSYYRGDCPPK